jgi:ubiquinone/menaquinone biosynthesis C-methylase UbiE
MDQSQAMLAIARSRLPRGAVVEGDAFRLPFASGSFDNLVAGHFYGHLREPDRARFLAEARRVAGGIVIIDAAYREEMPAESVQERVLNDGSRHMVYKRYFTPDQLLAELGGGTVLHAGRWFVVVAGY